MTPFWYRWPSWLTEFLAGLLVASLVQVIPFAQGGWRARVVGISLLFWQIVAALFLSWFYETFLDANAGQIGRAHV